MGGDKKIALISASALYSLRIICFQVDTFCVSDLILPVSAGFEAKQQELVCVCMSNCTQYFEAFRRKVEYEL